MLELAGAAIRSRLVLGYSEQRALLWVNEALARRGVTALDAQATDEEARNAAIASSVRLSLSILDERTVDASERFCELAIALFLTSGIVGIERVREIVVVQFQHFKFTFSGFERIHFFSGTASTSAAT